MERNKKLFKSHVHVAHMNLSMDKKMKLEDIEKLDQYINEYFIEYIKQHSQTDQTNSELKNKVLELENQITKLQNKLTVSSQAYSDLTHKLQNQNIIVDRIHNLEYQFAELVNASSNLKYQISNLTHINTESNKKIIDLQRSNDKLWYEYNDYSEKSEISIKELNNQIDELKYDNANLLNELNLNYRDIVYGCNLIDTNNSLIKKNNDLEYQIAELVNKNMVLERINGEMIDTDYPNKKYLDNMAELEYTNTHIMSENIQLKDQLNDIRENFIKILSNLKHTIQL